MVGSRAAGLRVSGSTLSPANKSNEFWGSFCTCLFQQEWCAPGMEQQVWQRMGRGTRARVGGGELSLDSSSSGGHSSCVSPSAAGRQDRQTKG